MERSIKLKLYAWATTVLLILSITSGVSAAGNLISNGSFDTVTLPPVPDGWAANIWDKTAGATAIYTEPVIEDSADLCATIANTAANDARLVQTVKVDANKTYRFSAGVRASGIDPSSTGAVLSMPGGMTVGKSIYDTEGQWVISELYITTGPNVSEINLAVGIGGYGSANTGIASFNNAVLEEVAAVPSGAVSVTVGASQATLAPSNSGAPESSPSPASSTTNRATSAIWNILAMSAAALYIWYLVSLLTFRPVIKPDQTTDPEINNEDEDI